MPSSRVTACKLACEGIPQALTRQLVTCWRYWVPTLRDDEQAVAIATEGPCIPKPARCHAQRLPVALYAVSGTPSCSAILL